MRLATVRTAGSTAAARLDGDEYVVLDAPDLTTMLARSDWQAAAQADGGRLPAEATALDPAVRPTKTLCVGLNYRSHILEMGRELPEHPTLFGKFSDALTGPYDPITLPRVSEKVDWEVELGVVIGRAARHVTAAQAPDHIAGYTVVNDVSMRDWQRRTAQWLAGKNFEASTPVGPVLVTPDELDHARDLELSCLVDGETMQKSRTRDLLFSPADVIAYASQFITLRPGDLICTGTPGGVAAARENQPFVRDGQTVTVTVEGIGSCVNPFHEERP
ncbi:MAG: fumarylacetoacetate hydrolase family protein [Micromonosporaceae bacterium]